MRAERVLVVSDEMEVGGSQRQIVHLLRGLHARGRAVSLLYFRKASHLVAELEGEGIPVHCIPKRGAIDPRFLLALWRFLRQGRFDVVHAFSITAELWVWLALRLLPGTRFVGSVRGLGLSGPAWHWRAKRWICRSAAAVISNSRAGAALVAGRCGLPVSGFDIVPNGLALPPPPSPQDRQAAREALGVAAWQPLVLFVGRLVPEKDLGGLLEAFARPELAGDAVLWLAGEGPERPRLEARIAALGLAERVRLLGERTDTLRLMQAADLLVLPSREEGLSNVLLEAMGNGLPVVATAVGGTPELVEDGHTGCLVPGGDVRTLAAAIACLLADAPARQRLGAAARRRAEAAFSLDAMIEATAAVYDRCLASPRRALA